MDSADEPRTFPARRDAAPRGQKSAARIIRSRRAPHAEMVGKVVIWYNGCGTPENVYESEV